VAHLRRESRFRASLLSLRDPKPDRAKRFRLDTSSIAELKQFARDVFREGADRRTVSLICLLFLELFVHISSGLFVL
jgi:hypothetical protein